jgi:hypothetical protein
MKKAATEMTRAVIANISDDEIKGPPPDEVAAVVLLPLVVEFVVEFDIVN